ncbi:galactosylceramide sulfotransferase-like [Antedon mediterranea]|uniref:galactosylceramide sulfotransferase-like n=1 Tax=Antedon mediterranea TaxID=105859 RepID=UPI003AF5FB48
MILQKTIRLLVLYIIFISVFVSCLLIPLKRDRYISRYENNSPNPVKYTSHLHLINISSEFANSTKITKQCKPHKNIVFYKTHKCGSSTVQNIFLRFGDKHKLAFALPVQNKFGYDHVFSLFFPFQPNMVERLATNEYNILAHHCVYNKPGFEAIMPSDSLYVTIIREPVSVFKSHFAYFNWGRLFKLENYSNPIEEFLNRMEAYDVLPIQFRFKRNVLFQKFDYKQSITTDIMAKMAMANMERELDFVMLLEYLDESLILLKNKLCWSFEDILYVTKNVGKRHFAINESLANRIRKWSRWDVILYDRFNTSFWKQVDEFGWDKMQRELKIFKERQFEFQKTCPIKREIPPMINGNRTSLCRNVLRGEMMYTYSLRRNQRKRIKP